MQEICQIRRRGDVKGYECVKVFKNATNATTDKTVKSIEVVRNFEEGMGGLCCVSEIKRNE